MPDEFWTPNKYNVCGGVEPAFMSTSLDPSVAREYAGTGKAGVILEIQQGMVDRGADMAWLSMYPHEKELTFNPLTSVLSVDCAVLVAPELSRLASWSSFSRHLAAPRTLRKPLRPLRVQCEAVVCS